MGLLSASGANTIIFPSDRAMKPNLIAEAHSPNVAKAM